MLAGLSPREALVCPGHALPTRASVSLCDRTDLGGESHGHPSSGKGPTLPPARGHLLGKPRGDTVWVPTGRWLPSVGAPCTGVSPSPLTQSCLSASVAPGLAFGDLPEELA